MHVLQQQIVQLPPATSCVKISVKLLIRAAVILGLSHKYSIFLSLVEVLIKCCINPLHQVHVSSIHLTCLVCLNLTKVPEATKSLFLLFTRSPSPTYHVLMKVFKKPRGRAQLWFETQFKSFTQNISLSSQKLGAEKVGVHVKSDREISVCVHICGIYATNMCLLDLYECAHI